MTAQATAEDAATQSRVEDPLADLAARLSATPAQLRLEFGGLREVILIAERIFRRERRPALAAFFGALARGDAAAAADHATEAVARERTPVRREAARLVCALPLALSRGLEAPQPLFSGPAGWTPDDELQAAALVAHAIAGGGWSGWEAAALERIAARTGSAYREDALLVRFRIGRNAGLAPDDVRRLFALYAALERPPLTLGWQMAELIWLFGGDDRVGPLLDLCPGLVKRAPTDPLPAALLLRFAPGRAPAAALGRLGAEALRLETLERDTAAFWDRLADPAVRVALVGNSPCEQGRGRGADIDGHDAVVRFNRAPEDGEFASDYGARTDVKVFSSAQLKRTAAESRAPVAVAVRPSGLIGRRMAIDAAVRAQGRIAVYVPLTRVIELRRELGKAPSSGLLLLAQLRALRGSLAGVACFGFALTDQIAPESASNHYFETSRPSANHGWRGERAVFDRWMAEG